MRLKIWSRRDGSPNRAFTIAMYLLALGFALQTPELADPIDRVGPDHLSDLLHVLMILGACTILSLIPLRRPSRRRYRYPWIAYNMILGVLAIIASDLGTDPLPAAPRYQHLFALGVLSTCILIAGTAIKELRGGKMLIALIIAAVASVASAGITVWSLMVAPNWMQVHYYDLLTVTSLFSALGMSAAGLYGLRLASLRAHADRSPVANR